MHPTRRRILQLGTGLLASPFAMGGCAMRRLPPPTNELVLLSATEAALRMRTGTLSAVEYAAALLERAEELRYLNAFLALDPGHVEAAARKADARRALAGRLTGLPMPVKDSVLTADYPTTAGTRALAARMPRQDAELIRRLKDEGAFVMGKTNLHELSTGFTTNNEIFGPTRNPHDPDRIPGGSSGGTAAAVAAGIAPLGVAEDTAGSIRVPAALCGIVGFRPTTGRYPTGGAVPLTPTFDQLGPLARTVKDVALFDAVVTGRTAARPSIPLKGVCLGVPRGYCYEGVAAEMASIIEESLSALRDAGVVLVEADIPDLGRLIGETYVPILFHETWPTLDAWLRQNGFAGGLEEVLAEAGPRMAWLYHNVLNPGAIPEAAYTHAVQVARPALRRAVQEYFDTHRLDAMIVPATLCPAPPIGEDEETTIDGRKVTVFDALGHNTQLAPACELPALTLPAGMTRAGLPVAVELDAPHGRDAQLLALGLALQAAGLFQSRPPA